MKRWLCGLVWLASACTGAHRDRAFDSPDGGATDAPVITCGDLTCDQAPAAACADTDTLVTHTPVCEDDACSYPAAEVECGSAGCCVDHCCAAAPSNEDAFGAVTPTGLVVAPPNGTFDTSSDCSASSALGACTVVSIAQGGEACVCRMDELTIGSLRVVGSRALVLLALRTVTVTTLLDMSATEGVNGPGAVRGYSAPIGGSAGGRGGSFGTVGGRGGDGVDPSAAVAGTPALIPLVGGMRGESVNAINGLYGGGGGGGALQITAGDAIAVMGQIRAGGGGGTGGTIDSQSLSGASGGGSGGAILLEAPTVTVSGQVAANGGGGGGGGGRYDVGFTGTPGGTVQAPGGQGRDGEGCSLHGYISGGDGGPGSVGDAVGGAGQGGDYLPSCLFVYWVGGGGGGGGAGRIRVNTADGCQCNGSFSPSPTFGTLQVR